MKLASLSGELVQGRELQHLKQIHKNYGSGDRFFAVQAKQEAWCDQAVRTEISRHIEPITQNVVVN